MANQDQEKSSPDSEERENELGSEATRAATAHRRDGVAGAESTNNAAPPMSQSQSAIDKASSSIAAAIGADLAGFLRALHSAAGLHIPLTARRDWSPKGGGGEDDAATDDLIAAAAVEEAEEPVAATVCAALAARTIVQVLRREPNDGADADVEALFSAWLETARSLAAARGALAMRRLLSTARLLAQRAGERGASVSEMTATLRRLAARISADASLERAFGGPIEAQEPDPMLRGAWPHRAASSSAARLT